MYGEYRLSELNISVRDLKIWCEKNGFYRYKRVLGDREIEKVLSSDSKVILNPVEPVNLPRNLTNYLFIHFGKPVIVEPASSVTIFLTFPIEIGVFVAKDENFEDIDIFSFVKPKYALYGEPRGGIIARYWKSDVLSYLPKIDPLEFGIMKLRIVNISNSWCEVNKAVFDVYGMKIYYNRDIVSSVAEMRVYSKRVAETNFLDKPLLDDMKKALELFVARKIPILSTKMTMEWGI
ncbi:MAG: DUF432 domain-containing protein [Archaeoglobaceae archaeon]